MGPHFEGAAPTFGATDQAQLNGFCALRPAPVEQASGWSEQGQHQGPPAQGGDELANHQPQASSPYGTKHRQQDGQGNAGAHLAAEAQQLLGGVTATGGPAPGDEPAGEAFKHLYRRLGGKHVDHGGAVFAGCPQEKHQPDG